VIAVTWTAVGISNQGLPGAVVLMSNGAERTFLENLGLRAAELATSDWERGFALWVAEHLDVHRWSYSPAGFDVADLAMSRRGFYAQKGFLLSVVDRALADTDHGCEICLPTDAVVEALRVLRSWLADLHVDQVAEGATGVWATDPVAWERCAQHGLCCTSYGCPIGH
jgi:hypothetical protein